MLGTWLLSRFWEEPFPSAVLPGYSVAPSQQQWNEFLIARQNRKTDTFAHPYLMATLANGKELKAPWPQGLPPHFAGGIKAILTARKSRKISAIRAYKPTEADKQKCFRYFFPNDSIISIEVIL